MRLVLASASPARLRVLLGAGLTPEVRVSGVDEDATSGSPEDIASTLAARKARTVAQDLDGPALVLGCDTLLELDGAALGKPLSVDDSVARWRQMRGRTGEVVTGHCAILSGLATREVSAVARTSVTFGSPTDAELWAYAETGEPQQVAGAFTIDRLGGWFVDRIDGDHTNVIGISLPTIRRLLLQLDVAVPSLWSGADP